MMGISSEIKEGCVIKVNTHTSSSGKKQDIKIWLRSYQILLEVSMIMVVRCEDITMSILQLTSIIIGRANRGRRTILPRCQHSPIYLVSSQPYKDKGKDVQLLMGNIEVSWKKPLNRNMK